MRYVFERLKWWSAHVYYTLRLLCSPQESATAVSRYLAGIKGISPRPNPHGIIFFACDAQFMERFGYSLLFSCYEHARECSVHVHLYEPSAALLQHLAALRAHFTDMEVSYTYEDAIDGGSLPELWVYYTAFRFLVAKKILEEAKSLLICLDADSLIRQSFTEVVAAARHHDVGLYFRLQKRDIRKKIAAFCVLLNYTPPAMAFLEFFAGLVSQFHQHYPTIRPELRFHFDQSCLYFAYLVRKFTKGMSLGMSFYRIRKEVVDYEVFPTTCVWTAKGKRKGEEEFLQEVRRIREQYTPVLRPHPNADRSGELLSVPPVTE